MCIESKQLFLLYLSDMELISCEKAGGNQIPVSSDGLYDTNWLVRWKQWNRRAPGTRHLHWQWDNSLQIWSAVAQKNTYLQSAVNNIRI